LYLARRLLDDASLTFSKPVCGDASVVAAGGAQTKEFKVALVGNSGVGKSAMMHALISGQFLETHAPTPGVTVRALSRL
jgi:GTPase SAR1 family protein